MGALKQQLVGEFRRVIKMPLYAKNKAENADFQSYAAGRGYITMIRNAKNCCTLLMLSNANAEQC